MLPKLIHWDSYYLPTYGLLVATAFLVALWMAGRLAVRAGLDRERVMNLGIYCALAGIAGAKIAMFLFDWRSYLAHPGEIFSLETLQAAGVYQGGLLLALLTAVLYMRHHRLAGLLTADVFAPAIALGHAIGRLGCFSAGCCWGTRCDRPWAVTFRNPDAHQLTGVPLGIPLHPAQLYEAFANVAIFAVLYWRFHRPHRNGTILGLYLVLYSTARFGIEFVRFHEQELPFGLPLSITQWIALATLALGAWLLLRARLRPASA
ncbi:MAG: prolipoprotein diacylglyceryl transferase [Acidobacteria bacterium]|nr:prolipoprotein diacylglyceryl transferase [Acidobacteriota bacterium]MBI3278822.1 prolipoprotein diacylglyceryl transferase [Acidobacteriota bacterium]